MKHKSLFRLALKILGLYIIWNGVSTLLWRLSSVVEMALNSWAGISATYRVPDWQRIALIDLPIITVHLLVGLYLFFGGKWIADLAIPSNRPYCPECGYDVKGVSGTRCPECDTVFRSAPTPSPPSS